MDLEMGKIVPFKRPVKKPPPDKTLCRSGFHKWEADKTTTFDTKLGRLVTRYRCARCGAIRTEAR